MTAPLILGTNSIKDSGFDVSNSLRFDASSTDALTRTFSGAGNRRTLTMSMWMKRSKNIASGTDRVFGWKNNGGNYGFQFDNDQLRIYFDGSGGTNSTLLTNRKFRDSSAWTHLLFKVDTTQSTEADRMRLYINGTEETSFSERVYPALNEEGGMNLGNICKIGRSAVATNSYYDGYLCEVAFIDGQALDQTSFGQFDSDSPNIWKPKDISGLTFGTNGFYLQFKESGTSQNSSGLGADTSGNDNHFAVENLTSIDQTTDTCTNNFCTFTFENHTASGWTLSEGNLKCRATTGTLGLHGASIMPTDSGKWYFECKIGEAGQTDRSRVGIMNYQTQLNNSDYSGVINTPQQVLAGCTTSCKAAKHFEGDAQGVMVEYTASGDFADGDIIQFAMDLDNKAIYIGRNGTFLTRTGSSGGDPTSGSSKTGAITTNTNIMDGSPMTAYTGLSVGSGSDTSEMFFNFGNPPFAITSGNADDNGFGNFEHDVPDGYYALCTKNLAEFG